VSTSSSETARGATGVVNRKLAAALVVGLALIVAGLLLASRHDGHEDKVVDAAWATRSPSGRVRFCSGEDVTGMYTGWAKEYTDTFQPSVATFAPGGSEFANVQAGDLLQDAEGHQCDVIDLDVVYMKEFISKHLLYDMTPYLKPRAGEFNRDIMRTVRSDGRLWGVPKELNVGTIYYRSDLVQPPKTWSDIKRQAKPGNPALPGLRLPVGDYEGLTVVFLDLAYAAGAQPIVSANGRTAHIKQRQVLEALRFLQDAHKSRVIPDVELQSEEGNIRAFERGRAKFLRGWPNAAWHLKSDGPPTGTTSQTRAAVADNTKITSLPPWTPNGDSVAVLGGTDLVIPATAPHPAAALRLIAFLTSRAQVREDETQYAQFPVLDAVAAEPHPAYPKLIDAIKQTTTLVLRPSIPEYRDVSKIISSCVKAVIDRDGQQRADSSELATIQRKVQDVLDGGTAQPCAP
jgi:multiple sugar transport system substrate-binding protein